MRRYLFATTLSVGSMAALADMPHAEQPFAPQGALKVAQASDAPPAGDGKQKPDEQKGDHKQGRERGGGGGGAKGGGAPPAQRNQNAGPERRERGGPPNKPPAKQAQPQKQPQAGPSENRNRRNGGGDHREPARGQNPPGKQPPPREVQAPPTKTPDIDQKSREPRREEHRDRGTPAQQAKPQQLQPQQQPTGPVPAARGPSEGERDKSRDRGDHDRGPPGKAPGQPPQQAQPSTLPPAGSQGQPKGGGSPRPPTQAGTPPGQGPRGDGRQVGGPRSIEEIKRGRRQRVEEGGKRTITEEPGNRTIVQEKGAPAMIRHDEGERLNRTSRDVRRERRPDGGSLSIAIRPGGIEIYSEFDNSGRLMHRYRRDRNGREWDLIDNRRFRGGGPIILGLAPPRLSIPRERYIMDYERASDDDLYDALMDGPVDRLERGYSLDEIRYNAYLRDRMRRVDLDTVTFEFGAWQVPYDQYNRLERIAGIINRILDRQPDEVFLIEGHTDAVGSDLDNLTLSDRRAEEVAVILTETFNVPPENLVTQGYGEEFLKIPTDGPERINRRVAVRRITPLLERRR